LPIAHGASVKVLLRPATVPFRRVIHFDKIKDIWGYVKGVNSAYKPFPGGLLRINAQSHKKFVRHEITAQSQDIF
jgi:hypothetical protein